MTSKNINREIFWAICIGVALALICMGFVLPILDKGKDCIKNPQTQTCRQDPPRRRP